MNIKRPEAIDVVSAFIIIVFSIVCLVPLLLVFSVSITAESEIYRNGYKLIPAVVSFESYQVIFNDPTVLRSYLTTILLTGVGTTLAVVITSMAGFALTNKNVKMRNYLALFFFITMVVRPGLVPWYMMCKFLGLKDSFWALVIPRVMFNPFNLFLVRNFMNGIPDSLMESALVDGANDITIAFKIYFPLSKPVIATVTLFYGIAYWNDWFNAIMLIDTVNIRPLQYLLMQLQSDLEMLSQMAEAGGMVDPPKESFKMATAIITIGPIVLFYPYLQRYFIKGLVIGSVKG